MSKKHTSSHRKSKVSAISDSDYIERHSSRRSTRNSRRLSTDSPIKSPIRGSTHSPISAKEFPNLSQYFPSRKRSQSSPRNQTSLELKYTRIKSPNDRFRKRLLIDNPIAYGEYENTFDDNSPEEVMTKIPNKTKMNSIETKSVNKCEDNKSAIDFKGVFNSFQSIMDEDIEEDAEVVTSEDNGIKVQNCNQEFNDSVDSLSQMIFDLATEQKSIKDVDNRYLSPIPCHSRDFRSNDNSNQNSIKVKQMSAIKAPEIVETVSEKDIEMKVESKVCDSNANQSNSFEEDFDDSFDELLSEMQFPIEFSVTNSTPKTNPQNSVASNKTKSEDDDGFESDDDFGKYLSQIPNEVLTKPMNRSHDSERNQSIHNLTSSSMASSGMLTLSQIIDLINN